MASRFVFLDAGPLGLACSPTDGFRFNTLRSKLDLWSYQGETIVIPEIADYEVRRELIRRRSRKSIDLLDGLGRGFVYPEITRDAMRLAAELWARSHTEGRPTADPRSLDADLILVAQAMIFTGHGDQPMVITTNHRHIARFLETSSWEAYQPPAADSGQ